MLDGTGVMWLMIWSAMGSALTSLYRRLNLTCHRSTLTCAILLGLFDR